MKTTWIKFSILIIILAMALPGCNKGKGTAENATEEVLPEDIVELR